MPQYYIPQGQRKIILKKTADNKRQAILSSLKDQIEKLENKINKAYVHS